LDLFAAKISQHTKQNLNAKNANYYLQKAKNRIEEIGHWGLMPRSKVLQAKKLKKSLIGKPHRMMYCNL